MHLFLCVLCCTVTCCVYVCCDGHEVHVCGRLRGVHTHFLGYTHHCHVPLVGVAPGSVVLSLKSFAISVLYDYLKRLKGWFV